MSLSELTSRDPVLQAIHEFDSIGHEAFLRRYGFGVARSYVLNYEGRVYVSTVIAGAADGYPYPTRGQLAASEFSGGASTVAPVLRTLGLKIRIAPATDTQTTVQRWALAARPSRYRVRDAVVDVQEDHWLSRGKRKLPRQGYSSNVDRSVV